MNLFPNWSHHWYMYENVFTMFSMTSQDLTLTLKWSSFFHSNSKSGGDFMTD